MMMMMMMMMMTMKKKKKRKKKMMMMKKKKKKKRKKKKTYLNFVYGTHFPHLAKRSTCYGRTPLTNQNAYRKTQLGCWTDCLPVLRIQSSLAFRGIIFQDTLRKAKGRV
jgi:triosephosphate isomerase